MRILFLSRWFPYPPDNGSKIRIFNILRSLSHSHEIDLISFSPETPKPEHVNELRRYCQSVEIVPYHPFQPKGWRAQLGFFGSKPRSVVDTFSQEMQQCVRQAVRLNTYELVLGIEIDMAPYVISVPGTARMLEDVELIAYKERYSHSSNFVEAASARVSWLKWENYVYGLSKKLDGWTVASRNDESLLGQITHTGLPIRVIPNCVDFKAYQGDFGKPEAATLIYSGALTYSANFDAVDYFLGKIFPLIRRERPETRLLVTGRQDGALLERLPKIDGVIYTGYLQDIRPTLARSTASIVPLRKGGGTRVKILEALALGTPVISTSKGAEGLDLINGRDIIVADDPAVFAAEVLRLMGDRQLRESLSTAGKLAVASRYDWDLVSSEFCRFAEDISRNKGFYGRN